MQRASARDVARAARTDAVLPCGGAGCVSHARVTGHPEIVIGRPDGDLADPTILLQPVNGIAADQPAQWRKPAVSALSLNFAEVLRQCSRNGCIVTPYCSCGVRFSD